MRSALYAIKQMQVVGQHSAFKQSLRQRAQGIRIVIDAAQQYRLVEQDDAALSQWQQGVAYRLIKLGGMVGVQHEHGLQAGAIEPREQPIVDAFWQHDRLARVNAQPLQMLDLVERADQFGQLVIDRKSTR